MIELRDDSLVFSFPEVHRSARLTVAFQRTLRIPDDGRSYPLPPGLGRFPLRHVDDHAMLPMYQSEALWLSFSSSAGYPFAVKVATGKVSAVTGEGWKEGLASAPQDYLVAPGQPWLDGYVVEKGSIRQFVAMPLGAGYTAEEQLTGEAEHGGLQLLVYPMKRECWERIQRRQRHIADRVQVCCSVAEPRRVAEMGLAPGGRMRQEIYEDEHGLDAWDTSRSSRCFVHLVSSLAWRGITGDAPPTTPFTSGEYTRAGLPWFDYYAADRKALAGTDRLGGLKGIVEIGKAKGDVPLPENDSVHPTNVVPLREGPRRGQVREGVF